MKVINEKSTTKLYLIMKYWMFSLTIRGQTRMSLLATSIHPCTEGLARAVRQNKDTKGIRLKRKRTVSICDDIILYIGNPKDLRAHIRTHY